MKPTLFLIAAALVGCIDPSEPSEQLADTDQAVDSTARDRFFSIGATGSVSSRVQGGGGFNAVEALGGANLGKLATERNQDGRLSVFAIGPNPDRALFGRYQTSVGGGWNPEGWQSLGGGWIKQVVTGRNLDGRIELFVINDWGQAFHRYQTTPNGGWNADGWLPFSGYNIQSIAATRRSDGRLEVFAAGGDGQLYHRVQYVPNSGWDNDWSLLAGTNLQLRNVVTTVDARNQPMVLALDATNHVKFTRESGSTFSAMATLGDRTMEQVVAGLTHDGRLDVLGISGGQVFDCVQTDFYDAAPFGHFNSVGWGSVAQLAWTNQSGNVPLVFARKTTGEITFSTSRDSLPLPSWTALQTLGVTGQTDLVAIDQQ